MKRLLYSMVVAATLMTPQATALNASFGLPAPEQPAPQANPPPKPRYTVTDLGASLGGACEGSGINSAGHVAGSCLVGSNYQAFLWKDGVMQGLGTLGINFRARKAATEAEWHAALAAQRCDIPAPRTGL